MRESEERVDEAGEELPIERELARSRRTRRFAKSAFYCAIGFAVAGYLLVDFAGEFAFWAGAPRDPISLGSQDRWDFEKLADGAYVRVEGRPGGSAARIDRVGLHREVVALRGTPILVQRPITRAKDAAALPNAAPPHDASSVTVEGRIARDDSLPGPYEQIFAALLLKREVELHQGHVFVLFEGERPRSGWKAPAIFAGILALILLNAVSLHRAFRKWRSTP